MSPFAQAIMPCAVGTSMIARTAVRAPVTCATMKKQQLRQTGVTSDDDRFEQIVNKANDEGGD